MQNYSQEWACECYLAYDVYVNLICSVRTHIHKYVHGIIYEWTKWHSFRLCVLLLSLFEHSPSSDKIVVECTKIMGFIMSVGFIVTHTKKKSARTKWETQRPKSEWKKNQMKFRLLMISFFIALSLALWQIDWVAFYLRVQMPFVAHSKLCNSFRSIYLFFWLD